MQSPALGVPVANCLTASSISDLNLSDSTSSLCMEFSLEDGATNFKILSATPRPSQRSIAENISAKCVWFSRVKVAASPVSKIIISGFGASVICRSPFASKVGPCSSASTLLNFMFLPGNRTRIFPGCKSACKKLSSMSIFNKVCTPNAANVLFCSEHSNPIFSATSGDTKYELIVVPDSNVSTSTSSADNDVMGVGKDTAGINRKDFRNRFKFSASTPKSTCDNMCTPN
mmetsp:Transcript_5421/g.15861  ORF Transcript_5421/g.15861 Transcript_5421/m.15861 type:complete len:230 (-) Transcript_5421:1576-2265(-)